MVLLVDITDVVQHVSKSSDGVTIIIDHLHAASGAVHACCKSSFIVFVIARVFN